MKNLEISVFAVVMIIIVFHTVLTHLINWLWRDGTSIGKTLAFIATLVKFLIVAALMHNYLN